MTSSPARSTSPVRRRTGLLAGTAASVAVVASVLAGGASPVHAAAPSRPQVYADCQRASVEPSKVLLACADANAYAIVRHYASWTAHQARGRGTLVVNDCRPSCAAGTFRRYPATFGFRRVVTTADGHRVFSHLGVTYVKGGEQHDHTFALITQPLG